MVKIYRIYQSSILADYNTDIAYVVLNSLLEELALVYDFYSNEQVHIQLHQRLLFLNVAVPVFEDFEPSQYILKFLYGRENKLRFLSGFYRSQ